MAQAVGRMGNFEIVLIPAAGRVVEEDFEIRQRLAGPIGERSRDRTSRWHAAAAGWWSPGGIAGTLPSGGRRLSRAGLTMALRTLPRPAPCLRGAHVIAAGTVAALAIDAFRQRAGVERLRARLVVAGGNPRDRRCGRTCTRRRSAGAAAGSRGRGRAPWPTCRPSRRTTPAAVRSACRARCDADKSAHGCRSPSRSRPWIRRPWLPLPSGPMRQRR